MSKLIVITKEKKISNGKGGIKKKVKKRLILTLKKSKVTDASVKVEKPQLSRALDVVLAVMRLLLARRHSGSHLKIRMVVLDFANAFFQFPWMLKERRFFATRLGKYIYIWRRAVQGSRGAPDICGRALALAMRLSCALVQPGTMSSSTRVDDPISSFLGDEEQANRSIAKWILDLGFDGAGVRTCFP